MPPSPQAAKVIERQTGAGGAVTPDALADLLAAAELGEMTAADLTHVLFTKQNIDANTASVNSVLYNHQDRLFEIKRRVGAKPVWGLTERAAAARAKSAGKDAAPPERLFIFVDAGSTPDVLQINKDLGSAPLEDTTLVLYVDADYQGQLPAAAAGVQIERGTPCRPALDLDLAMALDASEARGGMGAGDRLVLVGQAAIIGATARVLGQRFGAPVPSLFETWAGCRDACL